MGQSGLCRARGKPATQTLTLTNEETDTDSTHVESVEELLDAKADPIRLF